MANLINAERIGKSYGTRVLLDDVSLGVGKGDAVGVVGRNGDGKTTLLRLLVGDVRPDSGQVIRSGRVSVGWLTQDDSYAPHATVRDVIVGGEPDHVWAADPLTRGVVSNLLSGIDLDARIDALSGGERRRAALVSVLLGGHDLIVLDEPTNHLDVEAIGWLAAQLTELRSRQVAMLIVSHDRWFLDAVCERIWEVHDARVDAYDGGYAAFVLARAERDRQASATQARRRNLLRKELAWLRRGAPARTSKPKFRLEAANVLIADEPPPRDRLALERFATARLGKDVFDLHRVGLSLPNGRELLRNLDLSIGPGDRIGIVGVNGSGKSTLFRLLAHEQEPSAGKVKQGKTLRLGHLSQDVGELDDGERVLDSMTRLRNETRLATGRDVTATSLLEEFGFTGDKLVTRIGDLSGGERRRLQLLRLLFGEPNVLLLDEPTNDLDIETLTVVEDYLDSWPGTLLVVSHDRYFLERTCDVVYALLGDGKFVLLPGGVEEYLARRAAAPAAEPTTRNDRSGPSSAAQTRAARKELARIEGRLAKLAERTDSIHAEMAAKAHDYPALERLQTEEAALSTEVAELEDSWLALAEALE